MPQESVRYSAASAIDRQAAPGQPAIDKLLQPGALGHVMHRAIGEVMMARPRARQFEAGMAARGPAMHHRVGDIGVKLEAERMVELERLDREIASLRQQFACRGEVQIPRGASGRHDPASSGRSSSPAARRADRVISDLRAAFGVRRHPGAELPREHLRAQANPQERPLLPERHLDPVDLPADVVVRVVGAHRAAENDRAGMAVQRLRKRIAEPGTPDIEGMAERPQRIADAARRRGFLVQDDQDRQQRSGG